MRSLIRFSFSYLAIMLLCLLLTGCGSFSQKPVSTTGFYFDTIISVTLYQKNADLLLSGCMELAADYEKLLSPSIEGSDIWNINHSNGAFVTVSDDTLALLATALDYARLSDGLVDPTIGSLSQLWNFGSDNQQFIPTEEQIIQALSHVDYHHVVIKDHQVMLTDPKSQLELGFIAKGYIADRMKDYLLSEGVTSALINLGGNVLTIGSKPDNSPFCIGIQKPFAQPGTAVLSLELSGKSMVSSGSYERYFIKDEILYHHILSPLDGYPVRTGLSQVTIISNASVDGDALSTLCFLLGYEKAVLLLENYPDVQAVFITENGDLLYANF